MLKVLIMNLAKAALTHSVAANLTALLTKITWDVSVIIASSCSAKICLYFYNKDKKMISQFCQNVKDCYWNEDRLFQDGKKVAIFAFVDWR